MSVYKTGIYYDTTFIGPGIPPLVVEIAFHPGGFRDYIYNQIYDKYAQTIRYVLRQPE